MKSIAIVSAGIRFPGAQNLQALARILEEARDMVDAIDTAAWRARAERPLDQEGLAHQRVYRVRDWQTQAEGLAISQDMLTQLDPVFHLGLGAARDAFQACKTEQLDRTRCGLILGNIVLPTEASCQLALNWLDSEWGLERGSSSALHALNCNPAAMPGLVIAAALGIKGTAFTLDAACASSLYALKLACDELMERRLDFVLAGGLSRPDPLFTQVGFTALGALSRSGVSRPLDAAADGLIVGDGAGIFGLKRLEDAEKAGDTILAVIRGIGLSNDLEGGLLAPSSEGQLRAMRAAYAEAEWEPRSVELIECHATGTALGDGTEIRSLVTLRQGAPAVIGSIKGNIGHMLTAAGTAGLAKLLLSLQHKRFWATANFASAPSEWELPRHGLRILQQSETWNSQQPLRRAALSGFGFGGINAHLLLEEYDPDQSARPVRLVQRKKVAVIRAAELTGAASTLQLGYQQFRIPPKEMQDILPQQIESLLAMRALGAMPSLSPSKMGCFVGIELDAMTNLFAARWRLHDRDPKLQLDSLMPPLRANQVMGSLASNIPARSARELQFGGPSLTVAAAEASGLKALELAFRFIARGELQLALVMATDVGSSHRARAQLQERFAQAWPPGDDTAVAVLLMEESKARELGLPVAMILEDFAEATDQLPLKKSAGPLWIEDMRADQAWQPNLDHPSKTPVVADAYRGAAHGLSSLLQVWQQKTQGPASFLFRSGSGQQYAISWQPHESLPLERQFPRQMPAYEVKRFDHQLPAFASLKSDRLATADRGASPEESLSTSATPEVQAIAAVEPSWRTVPSPLSAEAMTILSSQMLAEQLQSIELVEKYQSFYGESMGIMRELLGRIRPQSEPHVVSARDEQDPYPEPTGSEFAPARWVHEPFNKTPALYDYAACTEFATGQIAQVFGPAFAEIDAFPKRVRLPAERLLLCHRVMSIEAVERSMGPGSMVTEHDVYPDAWYLEDHVMPTSICIESGQGDLMLSAFLGSDFQTKGLAGYRLLDARVCFFRGLPTVGETVSYEIEIKRFFEQNGTLFFQFSFEATINGQPMMSMVDGCAGFFTETELHEGRGVKRSKLQLQGAAGKLIGGYQPPIPLQREALHDHQVEALRQGDYEAAFGSAFAGLDLKAPKSLPGGAMKLVHRILEIEPSGGRYGIGRVVGEADIRPNDWFLICHFVDDQVMPGTLMYECCLHTLRIFLMRSGWVGERTEQDFVPVPGVWSQLKCRGQVLSTTQRATYEIEIKEIGYGPDAYVICDALMYADGKPIVDIIDMSLKVPGLTKERLEALWSRQAAKKPSFSRQQVGALCDGDPSDCFGEVYRDFARTGPRKMPRLPCPPFRFLDTVSRVDGPFMKPQVGTQLLAHYEMPDDAWYWACNQNTLPLSALMEIALQPCGFISAYMGTAFLTDKDLKLRNLSGKAAIHQDIRRGSGPLSTQVTVTKITQNGGIILQDYEFRVFNAAGTVFEGQTTFGLFVDTALGGAQQPIRGASDWEPRQLTKSYPETASLPRGMLRMVSTWDSAGQQIFGSKAIDPEEWFYKAHFFEDPIMPGSLGVEGLLQLLQAEAHRRWPDIQRWRLKSGSAVSWNYRSQVLLDCREVQMALECRVVEDQTLQADGLFYGDGLPIYKVSQLVIEPGPA